MRALVHVRCYANLGDNENFRPVHTMPREYDAFFMRVPEVGEIVKNGPKVFKVVKVAHVQLESSANYIAEIDIERV